MEGYPLLGAAARCVLFIETPYTICHVGAVVPPIISTMMMDCAL